MSSRPVVRLLSQRMHNGHLYSAVRRNQHNVRGSWQSNLRCVAEVPPLLLRTSTRGIEVNLLKTLYSIMSQADVFASTAYPWWMNSLHGTEAHTHTHARARTRTHAQEIQFLSTYAVESSHTTSKSCHQCACNDWNAWVTTIRRLSLLCFSQSRVIQIFTSIPKHFPGVFVPFMAVGLHCLCLNTSRRFNYRGITSWPARQVS